MLAELSPILTSKQGEGQTYGLLFDNNNRKEW